MNPDDPMRAALAGPGEASGGADDQAHRRAGELPPPAVDADIKAVASRLRPGTALDLGCGSGQNSIWLARQGWDVLGVDLLDDAIERACEAAAEAGVQADFEVADIRTWEPPRRYDLVVSTYALPPVGSGRDHALAVATRAVAPGGTIMIAEFDVSLAATGWMSAENLTSVDELTTAVAGFDIDIADLRVAQHHDDADVRDLSVACVVARQPGGAGKMRV